MKDAAIARTGGQILVDQLVAQGVERVYCVPGKSYLAALDALHDAKIAVTVCRQETGAAIMALTDGRLTGRPGICFVTRGPGATNAAHGVHIAEHDSAPLVLFVGQVERAHARPRRLPGDGLSRLVRLDRQMGDRSRGPRAPAGDRPARVPHRDAGPPRPGRRRPAGRRPHRGRERRRRAARRAGGDLAGPDANGRAAEAAVGGRAAGRHLRRRRLERARRRRADALRRALRSAADRLVPPLQRRRQRPSQFRRRARPRRQSQAEGAGRGGRSRAADRRPHGGDAVAELHPVRNPRAAPGAGPRPRRRRRDRPRLSSRALGSSRRRRPSAPRWRACSRPNAIAWGGETRAAREAYLAWTGQPPANPGARAARRDHAGVAQARARRDLRQRRRQFRHLAGPLPALPPLQPAARARLGLDGLRRAGGDRRQARRSASASRSPSPATAIS